METHAHELLGKSILGGKPAIILGSGARPMNFVAVRDVATFVVRALTDPTVRNAIIEIGGPKNLTRNEVAKLYARMSGRSLRVRHIPVGALRVLARHLGPIHPGVSDAMREHRVRVDRSAVRSVTNAPAVCRLAHVARDVRA
jgi:uncharacterized protein YbjT (DUF2867 family)